MSKEFLRLPIPDVAPMPIDGEQFEQFTPEKFELVEGFLFDEPRNHRARANLLTLLLANQGLAHALALAPEERWRAAMRQVFGRE